MCVLGNLSLEQVQFLIAQKINDFGVVSNTSLLWWVTIVVFEATFIGALVTQKGITESKWIFVSLTILGAAFILLSISYGYDIKNYFQTFRIEIRALSECGNLPRDIFSSEIVLALRATTLGTLSMWMLLICLIAITLKKVPSVFSRFGK